MAETPVPAGEQKDSAEAYAKRAFDAVIAVEESDYSYSPLQKATQVAAFVRALSRTPSVSRQAETCSKCGVASNYMMHGWCSDCIYRLINRARSVSPSGSEPLCVKCEHKGFLDAHGKCQKPLAGTWSELHCGCHCAFTPPARAA